MVQFWWTVFMAGIGTNEHKFYGSGENSVKNFTKFTYILQRWNNWDFCKVSQEKAKTLKIILWINV